MTGEAVTRMEADLTAARFEVENLRRANALQEMELSQLRRVKMTLRAERDEAMIKCAEMRTIMEQVSAGLITGLHRMDFTKRQREERAPATEDHITHYMTTRNEDPMVKTLANDKALAESVLAAVEQATKEIEAEDAPRRPSLQTHAVDPKTGTTAEERRIIAEAKSVLDTRPLVERARVRDDIIDPRLPEVRMSGRTEDEEKLLSLHAQIARRAR
jgi:hypothetical protein